MPCHIFLNGLRKNTKNDKQGPFQIQHTRVLLEVLSRDITEKECNVRYIPTKETRPTETRVIESGGKEFVLLTFQLILIFFSLNLEFLLAAILNKIAEFRTRS
jgi:hypothetical protein